MSRFFANILFAGVSLAMTAGIVAASASPATAATACASRFGRPDFAVMQCRNKAIAQAQRDIAERPAVRSSAVTQTAAA